MRVHWHVQENAGRCSIRKVECRNPICFKGFSNYRSARMAAINCMKRNSARWRRNNYALAGGK
ncbi:hypothetical protein SEA_SCHOMBER_18 [Gordonia Phage Schomber]|nr:hypothetical protein SEA_SCHOMBER_18 [Gordonia Phage Schomber]